MSRLRFDVKPAPVLPEHRPLYKIAQLVLVLHLASRGGKSSLPRLQLFNWALKRKEHASALVAASSSGRLDIFGWGFDPVVPIALRFAIADRLVVDARTGYALTDSGEAFAKEFSDEGLLNEEQRILRIVGKKVTEAMVNEVARTWE